MQAVSIASVMTDAATALDYLRRGFVEDCVFHYLWPDGTSFGSVTGLVAFVDFARDFITQKEYRNTHHVVTNCLVHSVDGTHARMKSYVVARHINPTGAMISRRRGRQRNRARA